MKDNIVRKDTLRFLGISCCVAICLVAVMIFSHLSYQYEESEGVRGDDDVFGATPEMSLNDIDAAINTKEEELPSLAYFDRFYSKEERDKLAETRTEIYDLQWQRITLLKAQGKQEELKDALDDYVNVIGYHQEETKKLLKSLHQKGDER